MNTKSQCYVCGSEASTREHVPPRCFFPQRGSGLQLLTVPSCPEHNNAKSNDDQYVLAQICIHAAMGDNLAKQIFRSSVQPQLERSTAFATALSAGSQALLGGYPRYPVDTRRLDRFFHHLVHAIYYDRYKARLNPKTHTINHVYLSLDSDDPGENEMKRMLVTHLGHLSASFADFIQKYEAAQLTEPVYEYPLFAPGGATASITFRHFFYGIFEVVSLVTSTGADDA